MKLLPDQKTFPFGGFEVMRCSQIEAEGCTTSQENGGTEAGVEIMS